MTPEASEPSYPEIYRRYLQDNGVRQVDLAALNQALEQTPWDAPETAPNYRNVGVLALLMTEVAEEPYLKELYLNTALEGLQAAGDRLAVSHLSLVGILLQEPNALQRTLSTLVSAIAASTTAPPPPPTTPPGPVYLPPTRPAALRGQLLEELLRAETAEQQALLLTIEVLRRSPLVFYGAQGLRFLQLALPHYPAVAQLQLQLGLSNLMNKRLEGLANLHQARSLAPESASALQALHLAYRPFAAEQAARWHDQARRLRRDSPAWRWTQLPPDSPLTYIPYDGLLLAVEADLRSIVTSVLLAQEDWFEAELALWRQQLQPDMVTIDVGANVGVYSFSAATRVGEAGRVIAVEPFAGCVSCLEETRRLNQLDWVTICAAAASDRPGSAQLALRSASELNELVFGQDGGGVAVTCITLDSLIEKYALERVDWLKIDAEGHELQVLQGARMLLQRFQPKILYENVAAGQGANLAVGQWLQRNGYRLHQYRPFLNDLVPVETPAQMQQSLNLVALPVE